MKLKTKQRVITIISIIVALISATTAYLFASKTIEYEPLQIEGAPAISLEMQIALLCILTILNIISLLLIKNLLKHKKILVALNIIQLLFGGIAHIAGSITNLVLLFIETKDVEEKKEPLKLPELEKIQSKKTWIYFILWAFLFIIFYTNIIPMPFLKSLPPLAILLIIYAIQAIIMIPLLKQEIKIGFKEFKGNFKTYMKYIFPRLGIFLIIYIIVSIPIALIVGEISTNQQQIKELPIALTATMSILFAPIIEELIFRGLLRKAFHNDTLFIIASSLLFGAAHMMYAEENLVMYLHIIPYALIGYFLARTYTKTNNIFTNISIHFLWNTFCMILMLATNLLGV